MEERNLDEKDLFLPDANYLKLKKGFNWIMILVILGGFQSLVYLSINLLVGNDFYRTADSESIKNLELLYKSVAYLFVITDVVFCIIAAIKNAGWARSVIIIIGCIHFVAFIYYQFIRR